MLESQEAGVMPPDPESVDMPLAAMIKTILVYAGPLPCLFD